MRSAVTFFIKHNNNNNLNFKKWKVTFFSIKNVLISTIHYEERTLINFGFLIKEVFLYLVSILDFTILNVCNTFIRIQIISGFNFRLYRFKRLQYFYSYSKF